MTHRSIAWLLPALFAAPDSLATQAHAPTSGTVVPLQLGAKNLGLHGQILDHDSAVPANAVLLAVRESMQGHTDLNGDGDTFDTVLQLLPAGSDVPVDLGLAIPTDFFGEVTSQTAHIAGDDVLFLVHENDQGSDLNGDGDEGDMVLHHHSVASCVTTDLGLACSTDVRVARDSGLVWVFESKQGGVDLNGDGDALDRVAHHVRPSTGAVRNLGLAYGLVSVGSGDGALWGFGVDELAQGADLDGDGVLGSTVPYLFEPATNTLTGLGSPALDFVRVKHGRAALARDELAQGADLNGDGDLLDKVVEIHEPATGTTLSTGYALAQVNGIALLGTAVLEAKYATLEVFEAQQGADLNGDGDLLDLVAVVIDFGTGSVTSTGRAGAPFLSGGRLLQAVPESAQGSQDLNGDGDLGETVVNVLDLETWTSTNTGLAGTPLAPGRTLVGWPIYETDQGQQDLNGDGDGADWVWHVHDFATGQTTNLQLAATGSDNKLTGRDFFVLKVFEAYSGGADFNGDGDPSDPGILVFDARTGSLTNLMLAATDIGVLQGRRVVFTVGEMWTGLNGTDLNGDGDAFDHVLHVFDIP